MLKLFNRKIESFFSSTGKDSEPLFEISMNKKHLSIRLCKKTNFEYLKKLSGYLDLFSKKIIDDWEIEDKLDNILQITARSTQRAKELMMFFQESNLPIKIAE